MKYLLTAALLTQSVRDLHIELAKAWPLRDNATDSQAGVAPGVRLTVSVIGYSEQECTSVTTTVMSQCAPFRNELHSVQVDYAPVSNND
jgi:hypothetical protein